MGWGKQSRMYFYIFGVFIILWILLSIATYFLTARFRQHLTDFYPRWEGSRAALAGENPYSPEVSWIIQETMFGRRQEPYEIVQHYVYPATLTWLLIPFWILPYPIAVSLWQGLQLLLLLLCPVGVILLLRWELRGISFFLLAILSLFGFRHPINTYVLGQFIPFVLASTILAWYGTAINKPVITYLGLLGLLVRPEVVVIPIIVLLLHNWVERRRGVIAAWIGSLFFLWLLTRLWIGPWEFDFLNGIISYTGYSFVRWPPLALGNLWIGMLVALCVIGWGMWMLWSVRNLPSPKRLPWEISVSVVTTLILLPQTNNYTLVLALIPIWVTLWASEGAYLNWILLSAILLSPWVFYALNETLFSGVEQLIIPLVIGGVLTRQWKVWICKERKDQAQQLPRR